MLAFLLRRLFQGFLVMLVVALVAFCLFRFVGDPIHQLVGLETGLAEREALRQELGLNDPIFIQFSRFVWHAMRLDFGISFQFKKPVIDLIAERFPATMELAAISALLSLLFGIPLGVYTALHRGSRLSHAILALSLMGISLPTFLVGILLIFVFSVWLAVLPSFGRGEVVHFGFWTTGLVTASGIKAIILPATTLALFQVAFIVRIVRAGMIEALRADYIKFARARGLTDRRVYFGHALRNTLVPVITVAALQISSIVAFSIVTETVFQWPGMGLLFIGAVQNADTPVLAGYLFVVAFMFVVINLIADLLYAAIDPRIDIQARFT